MRLLLVMLLLLNVIYAGWYFYVSPIKGDVVGGLPKSLNSLVLLHELDSEAETLSSVAPVALKKAADEAEGDDGEKLSHCYTLGPFRDKNMMQQLQSSIAEYVTELSVRKRQESEKHRYWVHVPPQKSRKQAKLMAKKLRQKNINDFYVVLGGESKNSISLGHFKNAKHANRRAEKVAELGFKTEINVIYRDYAMYWLDYKVGTVNGESGISVDEYVSDGVSQLIRECDS